MSSPLFIASILITVMFFVSGFEKIYFFTLATTKFAKKMSVSLSLAKFSIAAVILLEIFAPLLITGYTFTQSLALFPFFKLAVMALLVFTVVATLLYHNPFKGREKYYAFMSNLSTLGGLLALYVAA